MRKINYKIFESIEEDLENERKKVNTSPTEKQKAAGNYAMGHIRILGFGITIENPKGSYRRGVDNSGKHWECLMHNDYGYFTKTKGKDGDAIDVFIGPNLSSKKIYAVDQNYKGKFDETKVMLGFDSKEEAKDAYMSNYRKGWNGFSHITGVDIDTFKKWLYDGKRQKKPFYKYVEFEKKKINENNDNLIRSIVSEMLNGNVEEPFVLFTAQNVDNPSELEKKYPSELTNKYYHHSTNKFGKQPFDDREGEKLRLHITGRLTTDNVDVLTVENPNSDNEIPHITLATANGIKPYQSNIELKEHLDDIVPLDDYVNTTFKNNMSKIKNNIEEGRKKVTKNDKGETVPETCPVCGSEVGLYICGEPVYKCSNKKCGKYFGGMPFNSKKIHENDNLIKSIILEENKLINEGYYDEKYYVSKYINIFRNLFSCPHLQPNDVHRIMYELGYGKNRDSKGRYPRWAYDEIIHSKNRTERAKEIANKIPMQYKLFNK